MQPSVQGCRQESPVCCTMELRPIVNYRSCHLFRWKYHQTLSVLVNFGATSKRLGSLPILQGDHRGSLRLFPVMSGEATGTGRSQVYSVTVCTQKRHRAETGTGSKTAFGRSQQQKAYAVQRCRPIAARSCAGMLRHVCCAF